MINLFNGRTLNKGDQVKVYRNLHKGKLFSIVNRKSSLVVAHGEGFKLTNVTCNVSEKGRQKVMQGKRKHVHATLDGTYEGIVTIDTSNMIELYYNPYELSTFVNKESMESMYNIDEVYFIGGRAYINK